MSDPNATYYVGECGCCSPGSGSWEIFYFTGHPMRWSSMDKKLVESVCELLNIAASNKPYVPAATQEQPAGSGATITLLELWHELFPEGTNIDYEPPDVPRWLDGYTAEVERETERKCAYLHASSSGTSGTESRINSPSSTVRAAEEVSPVIEPGSPRKVGEDAEPAWKAAMRQFMSANIRYRRALDIIAFGPTSAADGYDLQGDVTERFRALAREAIGRVGPPAPPRRHPQRYAPK